MAALRQALLKTGIKIAATQIRTASYQSVEIAKVPLAPLGHGKDRTAVLDGRSSTVSPDIPTPTKPQEQKKGTHCLPCAINHLSTCSGLCSEALRFARADGMASPEVIQRVGLCQDELNAMERVDLRAEVVAGLDPKEKEIAHRALSGTRELRHNLENMSKVDELEKLTAQTQTLRTEIGQKWAEEKLKGK